MVIQRWSRIVLIPSVMRLATLAFIDVRSMLTSTTWSIRYLLSKCRKQESSCFTEEIWLLTKLLVFPRGDANERTESVNSIYKKRKIQYAKSLFNLSSIIILWWLIWAFPLPNRVLVHSFGCVIHPWECSFHNPSLLNGSESLFLLCADNNLNDISEFLSYVIDKFSPVTSIGKDGFYTGAHLFKNPNQQIRGLTVKHIGYGAH